MISGKSDDSNEADDLRTLAFEIDDNTPLPLGYAIDELVTKQAKAYIQSVKEERKRIKLKKKSKVKDIEYNIFPDNNKQIYTIYSNMNLSLQYIDLVKTEYNRIKQKITSDFKFSEGKLSVEALINQYKLTIEKYNLLIIPDDAVLKAIGSSINNKIGMKLLKTIHSLLIYDSKKNESNKHYELLMWLYMLLCFIEMPLVDDDNSTLYSVNKYLFQSIMAKIKDGSNNEENNSNANNNNEPVEIISMKIVYIIISEIFKQKIIIF